MQPVGCREVGATTDIFRRSLLFVVLLPGAASVADRPRLKVVAAVLALFEGSDPSGEGLLQRQRPAPLPPVVRSAVIAALPPEGELVPTRAEAAKLATLEPIFDAYERKGLVVVKVIDAGYAFVGLHARIVLLLSRDALSVVTADELQALVFRP